MHSFDLLIGFLLVSLVVAVVVKRLNFPYPIALVIAGLAIALLPGTPHVSIDPEVIFYIFMPPILAEAAYFTSWRDFWRWRRAIFLLAFGLVTATTVSVAALCVAMIPGVGWPTGFLLGAIVSPPDAAAATSIMRNFHLPRRVVQILEGESLVNDAAALTVYRFAIAAIVSGTFSFHRAALSFLWTAGIGTAIGIVSAYLLVKLYPYFKDPQVEILSTFLLGYIAYVSAEAAHSSGVLAVVSSGLLFAWHAPQLFSANTRLRAGAVWETTIFLMNATVFLAIGLQLPSATAVLRMYGRTDLWYWGGTLAFAVILVRILWVFPATYLPRALSKGIREREPHPSWRAVSVVAWTGLRGVVSLAAAEALPRTMANGMPFPDRDLILFLTFVIIMTTLVLQGLTLGPLIKLLKIEPDHSLREEHIVARIHATERALQRLRELESSISTDSAVIHRVRGYYDDRLSSLRAELEIAASPDGGAQPEEFQSIAEQKIWWELAKAERHAVLSLRRQRRIGDEAMHQIERDIDLLEARIIPRDHER
ncbi:MAG: Na+/H+ antiporter [Acidobacteriaceae bacterium]|nr:Na+/H+ antiporter [Acidobacteriaceae bacterium]